MLRVQKFIEAGSGRVGYAMTEGALSEVSNGAKWNLDPSFSVADALLATIYNLGLDRETEVRTVRAFNKLLWLQNDLITRHYQAAGELAESAAA